MRTLTCSPAVGDRGGVLVGCGSSSSPTSSSPRAASTLRLPRSTSTSTSSTGDGVNPNAPESLPPGDIPDTTAYVAYAVPGAGYTVSTPEGWSRTSAGGVGHVDRQPQRGSLISAAPAHGAVTVASVRRPSCRARLVGQGLQAPVGHRRPAHGGPGGAHRLPRLTPSPTRSPASSACSPSSATTSCTRAAS